jgi:undecaprenyl pyrophosphate synthase
MKELNQFIITCESLIIEEPAMEGTTRDVIAILRERKQQIKEGNKAVRAAKKSKDQAAYVKAIDDQIKLLKEVKKDIGTVEESKWKNAVGLLAGILAFVVQPVLGPNMVTASASGFASGLLKGTAIAKVMSKVILKDEDDYRSEGFGNFTKINAYADIMDRISVLENAKRKSIKKAEKANK